MDNKFFEDGYIYVITSITMDEDGTVTEDLQYIKKGKSLEIFINNIINEWNEELSNFKREDEEGRIIFSIYKYDNCDINFGVTIPKSISYIVFLDKKYQLVTEKDMNKRGYMMMVNII